MFLTFVDKSEKVWYKYRIIENGVSKFNFGKFRWRNQDSYFLLDVRFEII